MTFFPSNRQGVGASRVYLPDLPPSSSVITLLDFFIQTFPHIPVHAWKTRFEQDLIIDNNGQPVRAHQKYQPRRHLFYYRHIGNEPHIPFHEMVLYQDKHLVVADKPHFLPVTPSGKFVQETLLIRLKNKLNLPHLSPLHRLDKDTAGLVLFSVNPSERGLYQKMFIHQQIEKTYHAVAPYRADLQFPFTYESRLENGQTYMQVEETQGAPNSRTKISLEHSFSINVGDQNLANYVLQPYTGKRHQLRAHMNALKIPIVYDGIYPVLTPEKHEMPDEYYQKPLQLLAQKLVFKDPITGHLHIFESQRELKYWRKR